MGLGSWWTSHSKVASALLAAAFFALAFIGAANARAAEDEEGWEMAPPIHTPRPARQAPRADAPTPPLNQPGVRYKQPPLRSERPQSNGPTTLFSPLRNGPFSFWECDRDNRRDVLSMRAQGGSCVSNANQGTLNSAFARHIDKHLFSCIARSAERAGLPRPARAEIGNMSGLRPGDNGTYKFHGRGRALDVGRVRLFDASNRPISTGIPSTESRGLALKSGEIMLHQHYYQRDRKTRAFYNEFRRCWKESLGGCDSIATIGCTGSGGVNNGDHFNHIHIQFPERCGR